MRGELTRKRWIGMVMALGCVAAGYVVSASGAIAGQTEVRTRVTINDRCPFECRSVGPNATRNYDAEFFGRVKSDAARCERRRTVILLRKGEPGEGFERIAQTKSDRHGDWEIVRTDKPGFTDYLVKVKEVRKAELRCLAATSDKESHDPPE